MIQEGISAATETEQVQQVPRQLSRIIIRAWGILRLPILLALLYWQRLFILSAIERWIGLEAPTLWALGIFSTPLSRMICALILVCTLVLLFIATKRLKPLPRYFCLLALAALLLAILGPFIHLSRRYGLPLVLLMLATNMIPDQIVEKIFRARWWNRLMAIGAGIAEVFFFRHYIRWLFGKSGNHAIGGEQSSMSFISAIPGLVLASGLAAITLAGEPLVPFEQAVRSSPDVQMVAKGNFNWIELDRNQKHLYVAGNGLSRMRRYAVADWSAAPIESDVDTAQTQSFSYDPAREELYLYNKESKQLLYLDSDLKLSRSVPLPGLSPGGVMMAVEPVTNTIVIASEADTEEGIPFVVLDRESGKILDRRKEDPGNLLLHPEKPILYMSFFRRSQRIMSYDLEQREFVREEPAAGRADRMKFWKDANELLLALPAESRVARYDPETLSINGYFDTGLGVRVMSIDHKRNLLVCGSLVTGQLIVIDITSGRRVKSFYLGPWLRTIRLRSDEGIAYVSSNGALYQVKYS